MKNKLIELFDSLVLPVEESKDNITFSSVVIPPSSDLHVGKDYQGRPIIILGSMNRESQSSTVIELENLRVEHDVQCRISISAGPPIEDRFSLVHCLSQERSLHEYFLQTMLMIVESIPNGSTTTELSEAINKLAQLFHSLVKPASRPTQGLWAELFLIINSNNPLIMIEAWHSNPKERFDFCFGDKRIEVKSAGNRRRRHHFSFEQAYPPNQISVLIASLFVEPATNGITLGELWDKARVLAMSYTDLRMKIENVCIDALGCTWHNAVEKAYDAQLAQQSLSFFDIDKIPRVSKDQPDGVSDIRFCSDVGLSTPLKSTSSFINGPLFEACIKQE